MLGGLVIDELHMVGDDDRGYLLELLLTKLRYASRAEAEQPSFDASCQGLQIVGMSATLPNVRDVSQWLGAALYETTFRPVPLTQLLKVGKVLKAVDKTTGRCWCC